MFDMMFHIHKLAPHSKYTHTFVRSNHKGKMLFYTISIGRNAIMVVIYNQVEREKGGGRMNPKFFSFDPRK